MRKFLISNFLLFILIISNAQTFETGGIFGTDVAFDLPKDFRIQWKEEVRIYQDFTQFNRLRSGISIDYTFLKKRLNVDLGFDHFLKNETDYLENRCRFNLSVTYQEKVKQWRFSYKPSLQYTIIGTKRAEKDWNPRLYLRNKVEVGYLFHSKPLKLSVSCELFCRLNHYKNNILDDIRTEFNAEYRINKKHYLVFLIRYDQEVQVSDPAAVLALGVIYKFRN